MRAMSPGRVIELRPRPARSPSKPGRSGAAGAVGTPTASLDREHLPHRGRPSDRYETWDVSPVALRVLGDRARRAQLPLGLAGSLAAEHGLVLHELGASVVATLNARASEACATGGLTDATAVYLRALTHAWRADPADELAWRIQLPARLSDRIAVHPDRDALLGGDLEQARRWEIAAVLSGATMTEWALRALLTAAREGRPAPGGAAA